MSMREVCDCCNDKYADYTIKERVKSEKWIYGMASTWIETGQLCEECFDKIGKTIKKNRGVRKCRDNKKAK